MDSILDYKQTNLNELLLNPTRSHQDSTFSTRIQGGTASEPASQPASQPARHDFSAFSFSQKSRLDDWRALEFERSRAQGLEGLKPRGLECSRTQGLEGSHARGLEISSAGELEVSRA